MESDDLVLNNEAVSFSLSDDKSWAHASAENSNSSEENGSKPNEFVTERQEERHVDSGGIYLNGSKADAPSVDLEVHNQDSELKSSRLSNGDGWVKVDQSNCDQVTLNNDHSEVKVMKTVANITITPAPTEETQLPGKDGVISQEQPANVSTLVESRESSHARSVSSLPSSQGEEELPAKLQQQGLANDPSARIGGMEDDSADFSPLSRMPTESTPRATEKPHIDRHQDLEEEQESVLASGRAEGAAINGSYYEPQFEGGAVENVPEVRTDIARESDRNDEELPERGLAQSLLSRFKSIENEATHVKQKEYRPSGVAVKATPTPLRPAVRVDIVDSPAGIRLHEQTEVVNDPVARTDVVKESDSHTAEELPERGMAQSLLSKFKTLEVEARQQRAEYKPSGAAVRTWKATSADTSRSTATETYREPSFEGGNVENVPQVRTDVVRESDSNAGEELPERGLAQSLLSRFKSIENEALGTKQHEYRPSGVANKATPSKMHIMAGRSAYVPDGTAKSAVSTNGQDSTDATNEPKFEGGEYENVPEVRPDVVREADQTVDEDLPQQGLAKNLLSRFKNIEAEASVHKDYIPSGVGGKPTPTPLGSAAVSTGRRPVSSLDNADVSLASTENEVMAGDLPSIAAEGGEYENTPAARPAGVVSEADRRDEEELPESGLAQSVLSKFKSLESQKSSDYQPSGVGNKPLVEHASSTVNVESLPDVPPQLL